MAVVEPATRALAIIPRTIDEVTDLAERLSKSTLLPKSMQGKMPDVLVTIMAGQEMGLAPMASLRSFHVIEGKPVLSADGMVALVLGSGKALYFERVEESETSVTYETMRVGSKTPRRCTWTMEMAKKAALHQKDNWRCYPRQMLASRSKKELAVDVYPDVLAGCYLEDEIEDPRPAQPPRAQADVIDAEFVESSAPALAPVIPEAYPELAEIDAATSIEQLKEIAGRFSKRKLTPRDPAYDVVNAKYKARLQWVKAQSNPTSPRSSEDGASGSGGVTANGSATPSSSSTDGNQP